MMKVEFLYSYSDLKSLKQKNDFLQIIPLTPMDYHPFLKQGYYGFNDTTPKNYIFAIDEIDDINGKMDCHVVGEYDISTGQVTTFRCGKSISCIWSLTVGEPCLYNINCYPNEKYTAFVLRSIVKIATDAARLFMAEKDVDQIRDCGGKFQCNDLSRPSRSDRKHRYNEKEIKKEDKDDYKDTVFDKDLKLSKENKFNRLAKRVLTNFLMQ